MTKERALHNFYSKFAKAYDENTVPDEKTFKELGINPYPRITYEVATSQFDSPIPLTLSVWDRSTSWENVTTIAENINKALGMSGVLLEYDDGKIWIVRGTPFSQRMSGDNDSIRRIYINLMAEFLAE